MSGRTSRRKGAAGELELAKIAAEFGFHGRRTPNSGGLAIKGDLTSADGSGPLIPGFHDESKRQETLHMPAWLRQAHADAGGLTPVVHFRRNRTWRLDPLGEWHSTLPTRDYFAMQAELRDLRYTVRRVWGGVVSSGGT